MMKAAIPTVVATALALAVPGPAAAQSWDADRVRLQLNGVFDVSALSYGQSIGFTEFLEPGSLRTEYDADAAPGFDFGLQVRLFGPVGLMASYAAVERDAGGSYSLEVPHPLYFDQPRSASGDLPSLSYSEKVVHLGVGYAGGSSDLDLAFFGGVSLFTVETELVEELDYGQSYPFDTISIAGTPRRTQKESPAGFHVGARVDYRFSRVFGLGIQARYSRARVELVAPDDSVTELDAGGFQVAAGVRLYF
jgi:hypothetical protein